MKVLPRTISPAARRFSDQRQLQGEFVAVRRWLTTLQSNIERFEKRTPTIIMKRHCFGFNRELNRCWSLLSILSREQERMNTVRHSLLQIQKRLEKRGLSYRMSVVLPRPVFSEDGGANPYLVDNRQTGSAESLTAMRFSDQEKDLSVVALQRVAAQQVRPSKPRPKGLQEHRHMHFRYCTSVGPHIRTKVLPIQLHLFTLPEEDSSGDSTQGRTRRRTQLNVNRQTCSPKSTTDEIDSERLKSVDENVSHTSSGSPKSTTDETRSKSGSFKSDDASPISSTSDESLFGETEHKDMDTVSAADSSKSTVSDAQTSDEVISSSTSLNASTDNNPTPKLIPSQNQYVMKDLETCAHAELSSDSVKPIDSFSDEHELPLRLNSNSVLPPIPTSAKAPQTEMESHQPTNNSLDSPTSNPSSTSYRYGLQQKAKSVLPPIGLKAGKGCVEKTERIIMSPKPSTNSSSTSKTVCKLPYQTIIPRPDDKKRKWVRRRTRTVAPINTSEASPGNGKTSKFEHNATETNEMPQTLKETNIDSGRQRTRIGRAFARIRSGFGRFWHGVLHLCCVNNQEDPS